MSQIEEITQTTASTSEESAASAEELNSMADTLRSIVGRLNKLITGESLNAAGPSEPSSNGSNRQSTDSQSDLKRPRVQESDFEEHQSNGNRKESVETFDDF
jgi:hypothetical protein